MIPERNNQGLHNSNEQNDGIFDQPVDQEPHREKNPTEVWDHLQALHDPLINNHYIPNDEQNLRVALLKDIQEHATQDEQVTVIIRGPAGAGKSTLATQLATKLDELGIGAEMKEFDYVIEYLKDNTNFPRKLSDWTPWHWWFFNAEFYEYIYRRSTEHILLENGQEPRATVRIVEMSMGVKEGEDKAQSTYEWLLEDMQQASPELGYTRILLVAPDPKTAEKAAQVRATVAAMEGRWQAIPEAIRRLGVSIIHVEDYIKRKKNNPMYEPDFEEIGREIYEKIMDMGPADRVEEGIEIIRNHAVGMAERGDLADNVFIPPQAYRMSTHDPVMYIAGIRAVILFFEHDRASHNLDVHQADVVLNSFLPGKATINAAKWPLPEAH